MYTMTDEEYTKRIKEFNTELVSAVHRREKLNKKVLDKLSDCNRILNGGDVDVLRIYVKECNVLSDELRAVKEELRGLNTKLKLLKLIENDKHERLSVKYDFLFEAPKI